MLTASAPAPEDRQAHYVRALAFDLAPTSVRAELAKRLVELIIDSDTRLATGFLSTGLLLPVLCDAGYDELAHRPIVRTGFPSWLGMIEADATTMWEWWDRRRRDRPGSLNHYSKGAVASFLHTHLAGLRLPELPGLEEAGYRRVRIRPIPLAGLRYAGTCQLTCHGPIDDRHRRPARRDDGRGRRGQPSPHLHPSSRGQREYSSRFGLP